jgi:hypothetical protein
LIFEEKKTLENHFYIERRKRANISKKKENEEKNALAELN